MFLAMEHSLTNYHLESQQKKYIKNGFWSGWIRARVSELVSLDPLPHLWNWLCPSHQRAPEANPTLHSTHSVTQLENTKTRKWIWIPQYLRPDWWKIRDRKIGFLDCFTENIPLNFLLFKALRVSPTFSMFSLNLQAPAF